MLRAHTGANVCSQLEYSHALVPFQKYAHEKKSTSYCNDYNDP